MLIDMIDWRTTKSFPSFLMMPWCPPDPTFTMRSPCDIFFSFFSSVPLFTYLIAQGWVKNKARARKRKKREAKQQARQAGRLRCAAFFYIFYFTDLLLSTIPKRSRNERPSDELTNEQTIKGWVVGKLLSVGNQPCRRRLRQAIQAWTLEWWVWRRETLWHQGRTEIEQRICLGCGYRESLQVCEKWPSRYTQAQLCSSHFLSSLVPTRRDSWILGLCSICQS